MSQSSAYGGDDSVGPSAYGADGLIGPFLLYSRVSVGQVIMGDKDKFIKFLMGDVQLVKFLLGRLFSWSDAYGRNGCLPNSYGGDCSVVQVLMCNPRT